MKLDGPQSFDVNLLVGALIVNPEGAEFSIRGITVDINEHEIYIDIDDGSLEWSTLKDWSIQFQGGT